MEENGRAAGLDGPLTPLSLLLRLRDPRQKPAWDRFVTLYTPLLFYWANRANLADADAADLVQDVFVTLLQKLPAFTYDPRQSFRGWLRTVTLNKWRNLTRQQSARRPDPDARLDELPGPDAEAFWEVEYRQQLIARALEVMQRDFQPSTWQACWQHLVCDRPAAEVALEFHLTPDAVYSATARVLRRLRQELAGFLD